MSKRHRRQQPRMPKRAPAYVPKLLARIPAVYEPDTVINWLVRHDDWCNLLNRRGMCNCDPDVEIIGSGGSYGVGCGRN
jgi:hypothetical protein